MGQSSQVLNWVTRSAGPCLGPGLTRFEPGDPEVNAEYSIISLRLNSVSFRVDQTGGVMSRAR